MFLLQPHSCSERRLAVPASLPSRRQGQIAGRGTVKILASPYLETAEQNPVQYLLYRSMEKRGVHIEAFTVHKLITGSWDFWHLHWPEAVTNTGSTTKTAMGLAKFWAKLIIARLKGTKIVWTVHNLRAHESRQTLFEVLFWRTFLPSVYGFICMTAAGKRLLGQEYPRAKRRAVFVIPHGHYRGVYPDSMSRSDARDSLRIAPENFAIVFLGQIREYKDVPRLIQAFIGLRNQRLKLIIAGMPRTEFDSERLDPERCQRAKLIGHRSAF